MVQSGGAAAKGTCRGHARDTVRVAVTSGCSSNLPRPRPAGGAGAGGPSPASIGTMIGGGIVSVALRPRLCW